MDPRCCLATQLQITTVVFVMFASNPLHPGEDELYIRDRLIASRRRGDSSPGIGCPVPLGGETRWQLQVLGSGPVSFWINSFLTFPRKKKKPPRGLHTTCLQPVLEW
ncbi:hypothetical protein EYF80_004884 [Liparis tanakae]|uniref:Uncharacterized protein n=1 Tax=Liparis tanakae TaxID=230148 RepID=A0A4Z2J3P5_9TELE|nr:hypothetical protein EYF80_004884 [Liparis tanakae]